jgi:rod shape-determining protein MreD
MIILGSFALAGILSLIPFSEHWAWLSPQWALLVVIYWSFYSKKSLDLLSCWSIGLIFDVLTGALMGQYALLLAFLRYSIALFGNRLKLYSMGGQGMVIFVLLALSVFPLYALYRLLGHPQSFYHYSTSVLSSLLLWPLVYKLLKGYEQKALGF